MRHSSAIALLCSFNLIAAELPVREVVLYKHGVGFFERQGTLGAGESARLDFRPAEMNDVLKSLTIQEKGGGKISGVRYDSDVPLEAKLNDFPFRLENGQTLSAVLDQLKGARIEVQFGSEKVSGLIVSARVIPGEKERAEREQLTLLMDNGDLRNFDLSAAANLRFTDLTLQAQFKDYLSAVTASRSKDRRSVYIDSTDAKSRDVAASYLIPTPIWKSSYRLMLDAAGQPVLEGWAIVDNTTGEDWTKVRMSLVSGKPISFISQLYQPRYVQRQTADLPELAALAPVVYSGAISGNAAGSGGGIGSGRGGGVAGGTFRAEKSVPLGSVAESVEVSAAAPAASRMPVAPSQIASTATGREAADLFEYSISTPVTVKKNESAMLPFLQQKISAKKLLIYSDRSSQNPLNAAEVTNSTGMTLDGGPITVYDGGVYAGEALMETVKASDKRLISYGVDLGTRITTAFDSQTETVREVHVVRGMLTASMSRVETTTYNARNVDNKAKTLIIEQPAAYGYTVVSPKPLETTAKAWRFQMELPANSPAKLPVVLERVYDQTFALTNMTPDNILIWTQNKALSDTARRQLEQLRDLKNQLANVNNEMGSVQNEITSVAQDEDRTRQNLASLNGVSGQQQQVQNYARQLAELESRITTLRDRSAALEKQKTSLQGQVNAAIEKMSF
jgi:flagellar biosynthesis chaperone FliJ